MNFLFPGNNKDRDYSSAWLTSLADLLALLLAFFVLLFSMSEIKVDRWQTLTETFGNKMSDITDLVTKTGEAEKNMAMINEPKAIDLSYLEHILNGKMQQSPLLANVEIFRASERLVISLAGQDFFQPGTEKESNSVAEVASIFSVFIAIFLLKSCLRAMRRGVMQAAPRQISVGAATAARAGRLFRLLFSHGRSGLFGSGLAMPCAAAASC